MLTYCCTGNLDQKGALFWLLSCWWKLGPVWCSVLAAVLLEYWCARNLDQEGTLFWLFI